MQAMWENCSHPHMTCVIPQVLSGISVWKHINNLGQHYIQLNALMMSFFSSLLPLLGFDIFIDSFD